MTTTYLNDRATLSNSLRDASNTLNDIDATSEASRDVNAEKAGVASVIKDFIVDLTEKSERPSRHNTPVRYTHKRDELVHDAEEILRSLDSFDATRLPPEDANDQLSNIGTSLSDLIDNLVTLRA